MDMSSTTPSTTPAEVAPVPPPPTTDPDTKPALPAHVAAGLAAYHAGDPDGPTVRVLSARRDLGCSGSGPEEYRRVRYPGATSEVWPDGDRGCAEGEVRAPLMCEISAGRDVQVEIRGFGPTVEAACIWRSPKLPFRGAVSVWAAAASVYSALWPAAFSVRAAWQYPDTDSVAEEEFLALVEQVQGGWPRARYARGRGGGLLWDAPWVLLSPPWDPQDGGLWHVEIFCVEEDRQDALLAHEAAQRRLHVVQFLAEVP